MCVSVRYLFLSITSIQSSLTVDDEEASCWYRCKGGEGGGGGEEWAVVTSCVAW